MDSVLRRRRRRKAYRQDPQETGAEARPQSQREFLLSSFRTCFEVVVLGKKHAAYNRMLRKLFTDLFSSRDAAEFVVYRSMLRKRCSVLGWMLPKHVYPCRDAAHFVFFSMFFCLEMDVAQLLVVTPVSLPLIPPFRLRRASSLTSPRRTSNCSLTKDS